MTRSIQLGEHPRFVATSSIKSIDGSIPNEIKVMDELKGLDRVIDLISYSSHVKQKTGKPVVQLITPAYECGSVKDLAEKKVQLSVKEKISLAKDLMTALKKVAANGKAHQDVHSGNFLLEPNTDKSLHGVRFRLVLTDMGKTINVNENSEHWKLADVFAAGCSILDMIDGRVYNGPNYSKLNEFSKIFKNGPIAANDKLLLGVFSPELENRYEKASRLPHSPAEELEAFSIEHDASEAG